MPYWLNWFETHHVVISDGEPKVFHELLHIRRPTEYLEKIFLPASFKMEGMK
jgi:hypothetical protein